ncbi:MAG TPA: hypothetical protein VD788_05145 [Candidatus Polarisedimenticolaceae bacterium]|nr:hypothetical protein [Candidatus Polarisedimenticolaceae bacterium]
MNRRRLIWFATIVTLTLVVAVSSPGFIAQSVSAATEEQPTEPAGETGETGEEAVEQILRQQEALITGQGFSYDPEGRRDPFRSPFGAIGNTERKRPPGMAGMLVAEIDLTGVVHDPRDGDVAVVSGSDNKGYFLRVGDKVYDGTVIAIDSSRGSMTFRQEIDDPRRIKPYRDIVKRLVPLEDEESGDE